MVGRTIVVHSATQAVRINRVEETFGASIKVEPRTYLELGLEYFFKFYKMNLPLQWSTQTHNYPLGDGSTLTTVIMMETLW